MTRKCLVSGEDRRLPFPMPIGGAGKEDGVLCLDLRRQLGYGRMFAKEWG